MLALQEGRPVNYGPRFSLSRVKHAGHKSLYLETERAKTKFRFSGPYCRIWPAKLANRSAFTLEEI